MWAGMLLINGPSQGVATMAWTPTELLRIEAIEAKMNQMQTAMNNLATKRQLLQLLNIRQAEIEQLKTDYAALEQRVHDLENP